MRTKLAAAVLLAAGLALGDEASDRAQIEATVSALNKAQNQTERQALFTADADNDLNRLPASGGQPWSEVSAPILIIQTVRFVSPEVALVDAANSRFGSTVPVQRTPVLLVMRKEQNAWKIASARILLAPGNFPQPIQ
jgi:hypothetical protein